MVANNCSTFASDAWNSMTGENLSPSNGFWHSPSALGDSITNANGGASNNYTGETNPGNSGNNHATSSSASGSSGSSSSHSSGNSAASSSLPNSSADSSIASW